jgi:hypothetical protein
MFVTILFTVAAIVVVLIVVIAKQPDEFRVTRRGSVSAAPAVVFARVNDLHKWRAWSPWERIDPALKRTFEGPSAGTGAIYRWAGNNKAGEGSMTITESRPGELIRFRLEFLKPFKATNTAEFTFKPEGNQTVVMWSMAGRKNFASKAFGIFMNMDKLVGSDFEKGLAAMKSVVEGAGKR